MSELIRKVTSPQAIAAEAVRLREVAQKEEIAPESVLEIFERWGGALNDRELNEVPGVAFLRLWLRRGTLEPVLLRELGANALGAFSATPYLTAEHPGGTVFYRSKVMVYRLPDEGTD